jgi:acyl carrier protein
METGKMDPIEANLSNYIVTQVMKRPKYELKSGEPLISSGLIDSFHLVDLAVHIEDTYGVRIEDTELNADTFDTVGQLAEIIRQRQK